MAVTFPNSPTLGQEYTAENGLIYIWDGEKWKTQGSYAGDQGLYILKDGSNTTLYADDDAVGIGTTSPIHTLSVDGTILTTNAFYGSNQDSAYLVAGTSIYDGTTTSWGSRGFQHRIKSNSSGVGRVTIDSHQGEFFCVDSTGKVGIGTSDPTTALHISGESVNDSRMMLTRAGSSGVVGVIGNDLLLSGVGTDDTNGGLVIYTGGSESARMLANGNFGLGLNNPMTPLHVNGTIRTSDLSGSGNRAVYSAASGSLTNSSSDGRLKTNVTTLDSQLEVVKQLNPVSFNWIDTDERGAQLEIGFIAQEVQPLVPEVVGTNNDGTLTVDYPKMVATLTKALQEALTEIDGLKARVTELEGN